VGRCEEDEGAREGTGVASIVSVHEGHDLALDAFALHPAAAETSLAFLVGEIGILVPARPFAAAPAVGAVHRLGPPAEGTGGGPKHVHGEGRHGGEDKGEARKKLKLYIAIS